MTQLRTNGIALAIVLVSIAGYLPFAPVRLYDFRAFYCAGKAIIEHGDPYREHPLHECERDSIAPGMPVDADDVTVPAPLPGYVLGFFALLSTVRFGACALLWIGASIGAVCTSIYLLRRVIGLPVPTIAVAIFLPAAVVALPLGQLAPFVGCAIAICAYGLTFAKWRLAAVGALGTSFDPAVALVLCAALLLAVPATRAPILWGTAALVVLSLVTLGVDGNVEYLHVVLRAHAAGNVAERAQFSATHFAWVLGVGSRVALIIGNLWYGCAAVIGIWIAVRLHSRIGVAALAFVPPTFAVFGGLYVHFSQMTLAIPAFLMVMSQCRAMRLWIMAGIFVLAVPWLALAAFPPFAVALVVLGIAFTRDIEDVKVGLRLGLSSAALLTLLFVIALAMVHVPSTSFHGSVVQNPLAEIGWSRYVAWRDPRPNPLFLLLQLPTILAFTTCLAALLSRACAGKRCRRFLYADG